MPISAQLLTVEDVAEKLRFRPYTVRKKVRQGILPAVKFGRMIRFEADAIERWLKTQSALQRRGAAVERA